MMLNHQKFPTSIIKGVTIVNECFGCVHLINPIILQIA